MGVFSHLIHPSSPDSLGTGWSNSMCPILQIWKKALNWCCGADIETSYSVAAQELKEVRASITQKYATQIEDMQVELSARAKELEESAAMFSHQQSTIEALKQHLAVAAKSRLDAEEAIERS